MHFYSDSFKAAKQEDNQVNDQWRQ